MRSLRRLALLLLLVTATASLPARAQTPGTCAPGVAHATLMGNAVRAGLYTTGGLFWRNTGSGGQTEYAVPRPALPGVASPAPVFAAALWLGGYVGSDLRVSAADYGSYELWPGPLGAGGTLPRPTDCTPYDRIFRIARADLDAYAATGATTADLREWPVAWGAPVVDGDGVAGNYNLAGGDRPRLWGDEMAWWVMNDVGGAKTSTATAPIGLEVRVLAFAVHREGALGNATFYRYTVVNRSPRALTDAYAGLWVDADLGNAADDLAGSDSARSLAYVYNGDNDDEGSDGYGTSPPAIGVRLVEGPLVAAPDDVARDPDGTVWPGRSRLRLGSVGRTAKAAPNGDPATGTTQIYQALRGLSNDGAVMRACGNGFDTALATCAPTRFLYSGEPESRTGWSELNLFPSRTPLVAASPGDRRMLASAGPFEIGAGETQTLAFALVYARGGNHLNSVTQLKRASDTIQTAWTRAEVVSTAAGPPTDAPGTAGLAVRPQPLRSTGRVAVTLARPGPARVDVTDLLGRPVATLHDGPLAAGETGLALDVRGWAPGLYLVRLRAGATAETQRLVVTR